MPVAHLHAPLIEALKPRLPQWRFVAREQHFKRSPNAGTLWYMHLAFVNHSDDFDAIVDVAVQFVRDKKSVCVVGAQLGNIAGVGQTRHKIRSLADVPQAAESIVREFQAIGVPFLERFANPAEVLAVLEQGGREAALISPLTDRDAAKIRALEQMMRDDAAKRL